MDELERKLRQYYESIEPDADFIERLKALEHSPEAMRQPRRVRRYLLPAAAAVMAVAALGAGWAYLRSSMPGNAPQPASAVYEAPAEDSKDEDYVNPPAPEPAVPNSEPAPEPQAAEPEPEAPAAKEPAVAQEPQTAPESQQTPAAQSPAQSTPPEPEPQSPPTPENPIKNDPPAGDPERPENEPPKKPEDTPDPPEEKPQDNTGSVPIIFAQYQTEGSRETLTLSNLTTYEIAVIDVTGLLPPPEETSLSAPTAEAEPAAYSGECTAFGWTIRYTLVQLGSEVYAVAEALSQN